MKLVNFEKQKETLDRVPGAPKHLSTVAKHYYKKMGNILAKEGKIKQSYLVALEIFATNMEIFVYANEAINKKNKESSGSGFVQKYSSGATNITTELVLKKTAEKELFKCFEIFGMDPKSDKNLKSSSNPGQFSLFEEFLKQKSS